MSEHDIKGRILQINEIKSLEEVRIAISNLLQYANTLVPDNDYDLVPKWYVDLALGDPGILITGTSDSNGEYDASAEGIRGFPVVTIYDQNELQSAAQYDNTNKKIVGMAASTAFTARFI